MKTLVFGASGGIGSATSNLLKENNNQVIELSSKNVDFTDMDSGDVVSYYLKKNDPDVIINCAGFLTDNHDSGHNTLYINVESNWSIIRYYIDNPPNKPIHIILVGSSAYREGKKQYMMYSASKAALHNLWEGAVDYFKNTNVTVSIIHPVRTRTNMTINRFSPELDYFEPEEVAERILSIINDNESKCIKISFEEKQ